MEISKNLKKMSALAKKIRAAKLEAHGVIGEVVKERQELDKMELKLKSILKL